MNRPRATYRLQFRNGMTFERAAGIADYLARLGISHLYASPLFAAVPGSIHGYDGIDYAALEPEIGGEAGFEQLSVALRSAGLELLLDFAPNHMAAADSNRWWQAVLEWGAASPYAVFFDIDWSAPKLLLPILGVSYDEALRDDLFGVAFDAASGSFAFTCYDHRLALTPPSYEDLLACLEDAQIAGLAQHFGRATRAEAEDLKRRLAQLAADPRHATAIAKAVAVAGKDNELLDRLHEAQTWQLVHWRRGRETLTYRRFFEISDLIGLRVEDPTVFKAAHARLFELIASGRVAGVRLDHIDGLADPKGYLQRFQNAVGGAEPCYLLVEKIVEGEERLPADWPVAGTTGYEFIAALAGLFVDRAGEAAMSDAYHRFIGGAVDYAAAALGCKREIFEYNLAAELKILTARAQACAAGDSRNRDIAADKLRRAIVELAAALPVYRTYVDENGPDETDRRLIAEAEIDAKAASPAAAAAVDFIARLWRLDLDGPASRIAALAFTSRFQQTTGPIMAKAIEDTLFYRYNRLIALNEVGGTPGHYGARIEAFHSFMRDRQERQPGGLSATSTHDTKRGEDARARLYALSEMPEVWQRAVAHWASLNARHRTLLPGGPAPEAAVEWLFYQALAGAWPATLDLGERADRAGNAEPALTALRERLRAFMEKAVREAKLRTSWTDPDPAYEAAVADFVTAALSLERSGEFLRHFERTCWPLWLAGAVNGLAQQAIKLTAPGVPDIYQGTELWDFSLVDPDNRRPVDFDLRRSLLHSASHETVEASLERWISGAPKLALTLAALKLRQDRPTLFAEGAYVPLSATGCCADHLFAFARHLDRDLAAVIAPRCVLALTAGAVKPLVPAERWGDTVVELPPMLRGKRMRDVMTERIHDTGSHIAVQQLLASFPVALLVDEE